MEKNLEVLSDLVHHMKYAKYLPEKNRRETYKETVDRNKQMHIDKYPDLKDEIEDAYQHVYSKKVIPSMRSMQFAGMAINVNPTRMFNCSYLPITDTLAFAETMFLLLSGAGVGYSVQRHHVDQLADITSIKGVFRKREFQGFQKFFMIPFRIREVLLDPISYVLQFQLNDIPTA